MQGKEGREKITQKTKTKNFKQYQKTQWGP